MRLAHENCERWEPRDNGRGCSCPACREARRQKLRERYAGEIMAALLTRPGETEGAPPVRPDVAADLAVTCAHELVRALEDRPDVTTAAEDLALLEQAARELGPISARPGATIADLDAERRARMAPPAPADTLPAPHTADDDAHQAANGNNEGG